MQVKIRHVHVRLEYLDTPTARPIAIGISMEGLRLCGCDAAGMETYIDDSKDKKKQQQLKRLGATATQTHRLLKLDQLAVYVSTPELKHQLSRELSTTATETRPLTGKILGAAAMPTLAEESRQCILEPISLAVLVAIGEPPGKRPTISYASVKSILAADPHWHLDGALQFCSVFSILPTHRILWSFQTSRRRWRRWMCRKWMCGCTGHSTRTLSICATGSPRLRPTEVIADLATLVLSLRFPQCFCFLR